MTKCTAITQGGSRCKGIAIDSSGYCHAHHPDRAEQRSQAARKGGQRGGRGRPQVELGDIKERLKRLANGVLLGKIDRADAAVVGQLYNTLVRCISVELKAREQMELIERLEQLEAVLERQNERGRRGYA